MAIEVTGVVAGAAVLGALASIVIVQVAKWLPRRMEAEWIADGKEAASAEPMEPVRVGRPEGALVGLLSAALCAFSIAIFGVTTAGLLACALSLLLIVGCVIDLHTMILPDDITLPLLWIGLLANSSGLFVSASASIVGAAVGYVTLWFIYWAYRLLMGREGMGYGDFKLMAAIGAWVGWTALPAVGLAAGLAGSMIALVAWVKSGFKKPAPLPFGPYLAIGGVVAFFALGCGVNPTEIVVRMIGAVL